MPIFHPSALMGSSTGDAPFGVCGLMVLSLAFQMNPSSAHAFALVRSGNSGPPGRTHVLRISCHLLLEFLVAVRDQCFVDPVDDLHDGVVAVVGAGYDHTLQKVLRVGGIVE